MDRDLFGAGDRESHATRAHRLCVPGGAKTLSASTETVRGGMLQVQVRDLPAARPQRTTDWVTASDPTDRATSSIQPVPQLLGGAKPVALGHQFGYLVPIGVVVEHDANDGGRPWRLVERRPGAGQGRQLVAR